MEEDFLKSDPAEVKAKVFTGWWERISKYKMENIKMQVLNERIPPLLQLNLIGTGRAEELHKFVHEIFTTHHFNF